MCLGCFFLLEEKNNEFVVNQCLQELLNIVQKKSVSDTIKQKAIEQLCDICCLFLEKENDFVELITTCSDNTVKKEMISKICDVCCFALENGRAEKANDEDKRELISKCLEILSKIADSKSTNSSINNELAGGITKLQKFMKDHNLSTNTKLEMKFFETKLSLLNMENIRYVSLKKTSSSYSGKHWEVSIPPQYKK